MYCRMSNNLDDDEFLSIGKFGTDDMFFKFWKPFTSEMCRKHYNLIVYNAI